jgi:hypothetical protein
MDMTVLGNSWDADIYDCQENSRDPNPAIICTRITRTVGQMPKKNILCHVTWNNFVTQVTPGEPRGPSTGPTPGRRPVAVEWA